jgi:hypothetical protein
VQSDKTSWSAFTIDVEKTIEHSSTEAKRGVYLFCKTKEIFCKRLAFNDSGALPFSKAVRRARTNRLS